MQHMSGLDSLFLHIETRETPMHVGSLNLVELPSGYDASRYAQAVKQHITSRMHLAPVFRRRLASVALDLANPIWVEADADIDHHVQRLQLPKPGSMSQLEQLVADLHSELLDRDRPLWRAYVIEGLSSGHIGFYAKVHHAAVDGQAGVALAQALLDVTPEPRNIKAPPAELAKKMPRKRTLFGAAFGNVIAQYAKAIRAVPEAVRTVSSLITSPRSSGIGALSGYALGPKTPLNVAIGVARCFATASIPLADAKQLGKLLNATLNDIVLATCSGALRQYLSDHDALPAKPLIAAVPVSLRDAGNTQASNQVSMLFSSLATDIADPLQRLHAIRAAIDNSKTLSGSMKSVIPTDFPSLGIPWLFSLLAKLYGKTKLASRIPPIANVIISNVPGPPFALYLAGGRFLNYFPVSIPIHGLALNITVQSYNGALDFGLIAGAAAVPDVRELARYLLEAFNELKMAALRADEVPAPAVKAVQIAKRKPAIVKKTTVAKKSATKSATKSKITKSNPVKKQAPSKIANKSKPAAKPAPRKRTTKSAAK